MPSATTSAGSMLATVGVWGFGAMIAITVVVALAVFVEETWPGSVMTKAVLDQEKEDSARPTLFRNMRRILWRLGWFGWLAWLGMWCGLVGAIGIFVGVPWAVLEERTERKSREVSERELVGRQCGDLSPAPPSLRVLDGIVHEDPEVTKEVVQRWRAYSDCRARALGREPLRRDWPEGRTDSTFAPQPARGLPF
jgi:hypothetical protein